jgi:hypothetical protein
VQWLLDDQSSGHCWHCHIVHMRLPSMSSTWRCHCHDGGGSASCSLPGRLGGGRRRRKEAIEGDTNTKPWARVVRAPGSAIDRWLQQRGALVASRPAESLIPSQAGSGKARLSRSHFWVALAERDVPGRAKSISFQLARTALLLSVPFRAVPTTSSFRNVW